MHIFMKSALLRKMMKFHENNGKSLNSWKHWFLGGNTPQKPCEFNAFLACGEFHNFSVFP